MEAGAMSDMERIPLERKMTYGGILTIVTILVTAGMNWGISQTQAEQARAELAVVKTDIQSLKDARFTDNGRMTRVETLLQEILEEVKANR
jgi:hypothetical protein